MVSSCCYALLLITLQVSESPNIFFFDDMLHTSGHYYSYVRPDIRTNEWYRFDDEFVTNVDYEDVIADAYGGKTRRKRYSSFNGSDYSGKKRQRGLLGRIFSFGFGQTMSGECGFGYGGRSSSAYMLQYARRSDIPRLYLEK